MAATPYLLSELVPTSGLLADYPLEEITSGTTVEQVTDYSGNGRHLLANNDTPTSPATQTITLDSINGRAAINHSGDAPLTSSGAMNAKHILMLAKYDLAANFGGTYRGLISDNNAISVLVGSNAASSTKFVDFGWGANYTYRKNRTAYAEAAQEAPFSNFEVVEAILTTGFSLTSLQVGQQTNQTARRWRGRWGDLKLYSSVLSGNELRRIRLYYDLRYYLWLIAGTTLEFPDPTLTGIPWNHVKKFPVDWDGVTDTWEYEDGGRDFNERTDTPLTEWEVTFTGLSRAQLDIFDEFNKAVRRSRTFSFIDNYGVTHTGVRIRSYESGHDGNVSWINNCTFRLVKYP